MESPNDWEHKEVLWELAELNFCFGLQALDSCATTTEPRSDCQQLVTACFPHATDGAVVLLVANLGTDNCGLASQNWEEKVHYLQASRQLMAMWQGEVPSIIQTEKYHWSKGEIEDLENAVTKFYVQSFSKYFHHMLVVHCGLLHQALLDHAPVTPNQVKVLDPSQNTFYNTSVFALLN